EIVDGSPAERAGIRQGDVVLKMNGVPIKDNRDLSRKVAALQVGQTASFVIWRNYKEMTISVTIAKRPAEQQLSSNDRGRGDKDSDKGASKPEGNVADLGLGLTTITPAVRSEFDLDRKASGVLITEVDPDSDAAERGLRAGDRIVAVGGEEVKSLGDIKSAVAAAKSQKRPSVLLFVVTARGQKAYVPVKLGKG